AITSKSVVQVFENDSDPWKTGSRITDRTPGDGAAGSSGASLDVAGIVGAAPRTTHVCRVAAAMRRDVAQRAESTNQRATRRTHHCPRWRRLPIDGGRKEAAGVDRTARQVGQAMGSREVTCLRRGCL